MTRYFCKAADVSPSGYYRWLSTAEDRQRRAEIDERDIHLIKQHFEAKQRKAGALT